MRCCDHGIGWNRHSPVSKYRDVLLFILLQCPVGRHLTWQGSWYLLPRDEVRVVLITELSPFPMRLPASGGQRRPCSPFCPRTGLVPGTEEACRCGVHVGKALGLRAQVCSADPWVSQGARVGPCPSGPRRMEWAPVGKHPDQAPRLGGCCSVPSTHTSKPASERGGIEMNLNLLWLKKKNHLQN